MISEALRHQMYERFVATFGPEVGDALMEHLPPTGWADVATKRDVEHLAAVTKRDLEMVRVELRGEIAELRGEMRAGFSEVRGEMAELRGEIANSSGALHRGMATQNRAVIAAMFGMMATSIGGVVSVAALAH